MNEASRANGTRGAVFRFAENRDTFVFRIFSPVVEARDGMNGMAPAGSPGMIRVFRPAFCSCETQQWRGCESRSFMNEASRGASARESRKTSHSEKFCGKAS